MSLSFQRIREPPSCCLTRVLPAASMTSEPIMGNFFCMPGIIHLLQRAINPAVFLALINIPFQIPSHSHKMPGTFYCLCSVRLFWCRSILWDCHRRQIAATPLLSPVYRCRYRHPIWYSSYPVNCRSVLRWLRVHSFIAVACYDDIRPYVSKANGLS